MCYWPLLHCLWDSQLFWSKCWMRCCIPQPMQNILCCTDAVCSSNEDFVRCAGGIFKPGHCLVCKTSLRMYSAFWCSCIAKYTNCSTLLCHSQCACAGQGGHQGKCKRFVCSVVEERQFGSMAHARPQLQFWKHSWKLQSWKPFVACAQQSLLCTTMHW